MQTLDEQNMGVLPWSDQLVKVPKGKEHEIKWPQGTTFLQCRRAKTGHLMLPIGNFSKLKKDQPLTKHKDGHLAFTAQSIIERQQALVEQQCQSSSGHPGPYLSTALGPFSHGPLVSTVNTYQ